MCVHMCDGIVLGHKKNTDICSNMDETREDNA